MKTLMRKAVRDLVPYHAPYIEDGIKLDANENIYPILESLRMHMAEWVKDMPINYYPDTDSSKLRSAIAKAYGLSKEQVLCGVGSDQIIDCILRAFVEKGDRVVAPAPSFSMYQLSTTLSEGTFVEVPLHPDFTYDAEALVEAVQEHQPKIVFLCHPNNPTGTPLAIAAIEKIINCTTSGIVVIDEAYAEFHDETTLQLLEKYKHVVILRTFSKAYGLAGARIGYALANPELVQCIYCIKPPYNINMFTQEVAQYVIEHQSDFSECIEKIKETRDWVIGELRAVGFNVYDSATNFLWIQTDLALEDLREENIHIKKFINQNITYYRMSIGTDEQMSYVVKVMTAKIKRGE